MKKKHVIQGLKHVVAIFLCLLVIIPFAIVLFNSFKTDSQAAKMQLTLPQTFEWGNYAIVIKKGKLIQGFFNSVLYSTVSTGIAVFATSMAAYVLGRKETRLNQGIYYFILVGLFFPISHLPLMKVLGFFQLNNTRTGLIIAFTASMIPFCIFVIRNFIATVPIELDEAAVIDGASPLQLFFTIIFPLLKPVLVTVFILQFMGVWSDFMTPLYLSNTSSMWPMNLAVYNFFGRFESQWNLVFADIILTCVPVVFVYLIGQKQIISGMTSGALKS